MGVTDIFGMFDKVDDIILEPIKLVCDALHQPLKHLDAGIEKRKEQAELENKMAYERFIQEMDERQKENSFNLDIREKEEIQRLEQEAIQKDFERRKEAIEYMKQYQIDISNNAKALAESIGNMSLDLKQKAYKLVQDNTKYYLEVQNKAKNDYYEEWKMIKEIADSPEMRQMMSEPVLEQRNRIIEYAGNFMEMIRKDMERTNQNIDMITSKALEHSNRALANLTGNFNSGMTLEPNEDVLKLDK